jgi:hypothetical protein
MVAVLESGTGDLLGVRRAERLYKKFQTRPVFTRSSWINRIRLCSLGLEIS